MTHQSIRLLVDCRQESGSLLERWLNGGGGGRGFVYRIDSQATRRRLSGTSVCVDVARLSR